ncbi:MAG: hypothetical protein OHK0021_20590 [Bryobacter sp.]
MIWRRLFGLLFLAAILGTAAYVWQSYQQGMAQRSENATPPPPPLAPSLASSADGFVYVTSDNGRTVAELRAKNAKETKSPPHTVLEGMELRLFHPDGATYDLVKADRGEFYPAEGRLESQEAVEVQLAVPLEGNANGRILGIQAQGASLEIKTGKVMSQGAVSFRFAQAGGEGTGTATGAEYDPQTRELLLLSQSRLRWAPADSTKPPLEVESERVRYVEAEAKVYLSPWSKLRKANFTMNAQAAEVLLDQGVVRQVDAIEAQGTDTAPQRELTYGAANLHVEFSPAGVAQTVRAEGKAKLRSQGAAGITSAQAQRMDLRFQEAAANSLLEHALATGQAVLESQPSLRNPSRPETRILRSEVVEMWMRPGGEEMDRVETHAPGTLDFVPNRPGQRRRHMDAERMKILYGAQNRIQEFRAVQAATRTEPLPTAKRPSHPTLTSSKDFLAKFHPRTGELQQIEQWNDFRYQEGDRRAQAARAVQDNTKETMELTTKARIWDSQSSTDADRILLGTRTGDVDAFDNVRSSRREANLTQATANRMRVREDNSRIEYEGNAVLWQGENRLRAERIEIHRKQGTLAGFGNVTHQMRDANRAMLTIVRAAAMHYSDLEKYVDYQGGVDLTRPNLLVRSQRLRAYLHDASAASSAEPPAGEVEKIFAYGKVAITEKGQDRIRSGKGETGEYYTADGRLLLEGGRPEVIDTDKGVEKRRTSGKQLVWFANADRLIVDGDEAKPVLSTITRKK